MRLMSIPVLAVLVVTPLAAQQSSSYKLAEHTLNAGGHPEGGAVLTSASYRISLDSIGEGLAGVGMNSPSYSMDGSFGACYPPPGEVHGLRFTDAQTMVWNPEKSVGLYNLYRDDLGEVSAGGNCLQQDLAGETATDTDPVEVGEGFFYLVTAKNRLGEEGSKGFGRTGNVCP